MAKLTVRDLDVRGKRVFIRVDYNVPLEEKDGKMVITDATRIVETLPTYIYQFAARGNFEEGSLAALIIVAVGILPVIHLTRFSEIAPTSVSPSSR